MLSIRTTCLCEHPKIRVAETLMGKLEAIGKIPDPNYYVLFFQPQSIENSSEENILKIPVNDGLMAFMHKQFFSPLWLVEMWL